MADGGGDAEGGLLDLTFLTDEEKEKITSVLKADQELRIRDRIRLGTLRQAYEKARSHQLQLKDKRQCSCCERPLGRILNTGALCPNCGNRVDKLCRKAPHGSSQKFICLVCDKEWLVELQAREYRTKSPPLPSDTEGGGVPPSPSPSPSPSASRVSLLIEPPITRKGLYGSELVMKSLMSASQEQAKQEDPVCVESHLTTSTASSIVVKYVQRSSNQDRRSLTPPLSNTSKARKLIPEELSSESSSAEEEEEIPAVKRLSSATSRSMESLGSAISMYSAMGGRGDYAITGRLKIGLWYKDRILYVRVVRAEGLAGAKSGGLSDPYVKTYLLPDRSKLTKRKTGIQRKTLNPEYNEVLKNKLQSQEALSSSTLWLSVWDWDRFGRNQFLGEVRLPLSTIDLTNSTDRWYTLQDEQYHEDEIYRGKLKIAIKFSPLHKSSRQGRKKIKGSLFVSVKEAKELPRMDPYSLTDATVKLYLLPNRSSSSKKKTDIIKNTLSPTWNEDFEFKFVNLKELKTSRVLEATVWDYDRRGSNEFIGGLRLGPLPGDASEEWMDSIGEEVSHWEEAMSHPDEWVSRWHDLRSSMVTLKKNQVSIERISRGVGVLSPVKEITSNHSNPQSPIPTEATSFTTSIPVQAPPQALPQLVSTEVISPPPPVAASLSDTHTHKDEVYAHGDEEIHAHKDEVCAHGDEEIHAHKDEVCAHGDEEIHAHKAEVCAHKDEVQDHQVQSSEAAIQEDVPVCVHSKEGTPIPQIVIDNPSLKGNLGEASFGSVASLYSGFKGDYDITGEVSLNIQYKNGELLVYVASARGIAAADSNGLSDPYIKTYLLPDKSKHSKKKTTVKKKTLNPVFKETLKYKVGENEFLTRILWVSVWDWDRLGKNKFLGEVRLPLSTIDFRDCSEQWYQLTEKDDVSQAITSQATPSQATPSQVIASQATPSQSTASQATPFPSQSTPSQSTASQVIASQSTASQATPSHSDTFNHGELTLGLMFETKSGNSKGTLHIHVKRATNLPNMDEKGLTDGYVKLYLLPDKSSKGKRKTAVKHNNLNPTWDEKFTYDKVELSTERVLQVTVWDYDKTSSNDFVGGVRLGPAPNRVKKHKDYIDSNIEEASHWEEVLAHPGKWVEHCHTLRSSMDPREIDLSSIPALLSLSNLQGELNIGDEEEDEVSISEGGTISLSLAGEAKEEEFKTISVSPMSKFSTPPESEHTIQDVKSMSVRKRPEINAEQSISIHGTKPPSPPSMDIDPTAASIQTDRTSSTQPPLTSDTTTTTTTTQSELSATAKKRSQDSSPLQEMSPPPPPPPPPPSPPPSTTESLIKHLTFHGSSTTLGSTVSFSSMTSIYSAAGGKGDYDITGEVFFGVSHDIANNELVVNVNRARNLVAIDKRGYSNAYVKTYLLPDKTKSSKQKTRVKKKTLNPVYSETLKTKLHGQDVSSSTLWLSVWDWDRFGRNQFLGEVRLPLWTIDLTDSADRWYTLQDKDESTQTEADEFVRGDIKLGLMFKPDTGSLDKGTLNILIKEAKNLPPINSNGLADAAVKCYLLPNRSSSGKRKTGVIKNSLNPVFEEKFEFYRVSLNDLLKERVLEVTVWDYDKHSNNFIGGLRVGGSPGRSSHHPPQEWMDSIGSEVSHWEGMLSRPGEWIEEWHTLRPSMNPREVDLSTSPPPFSLPSELKPVSIEDAMDIKDAQPPPLSQTPAAVSPHLVPEEQSLSTERVHSEEVLPSSGSEVEDRIGSTPSVQVKERSPSPSPIPVSVEIAKPHTEAVLNSQDSQGLISIDEIKSKPQDMHFAKRRGLLGLSTSDSVASFGSTTSIYSAAGGKGDYDITGEVLMGIHFKNGQLLVHINRAQDLAAADSTGLSDPYIKTYLLPDKSKHSKKKTDVKKKTLNPVYNHTIKYRVSHHDLSSHTLWLSVWDWDRFGRNQFLGEIRLPLSTLDLSDSTDQWYTLHDQDTDEGDTYRGQLSMAVMFEQVSNKKGRIKGTLHVSIKQAKDLSNHASNSSLDSFVKCFLLPDKGSSGKRKTAVFKNSLNPIWKETFTYEKLNLDELANERVLEVVVWDLNKGSSSEFVGGLRLGPSPTIGVKHKEWMDSIGEEVSHWESVMSHPGEWIEVWHTLRTTMDYRNI